MPTAQYRAFLARLGTEEPVSCIPENEVSPSRLGKRKGIPQRSGQDVALACRAVSAKAVRFFLVLRWGKAHTVTARRYISMHADGHERVGTPVRKSRISTNTA